MNKWKNNQPGNPPLPGKGVNYLFNPSTKLDTNNMSSGAERRYNVYEVKFPGQVLRFLKDFEFWADNSKWAVI